MRVAILTVALVLLVNQDTKADTPNIGKINDLVPFNVSLGQSVPVTIQNEMLDSVTHCFLQQSGHDIIQFRPENLNKNEDFQLHTTGFLSGCGVTINNIKEEYLGEWELISWILNSVGEERQDVQPFVIIDADDHLGEEVDSSITSTEQITDQEDSLEQTIEHSPELSSQQATDNSDEIEMNRQIQIRDDLTYQTQLSEIVEIRIGYDLLNVKEGCYLKTPEGLHFDLDSEIPAGVEVFDGSIHSSCMIQITVSENIHGEWVLYSHESITNSGQELEIQQPFTVYIEEPINAFPKDTVSIETGKDMYIRLEQQIQNLETCDLVVPASAEIRIFTRDGRFKDTCGFIIQNVETSDSGLWKIKAVGKIGYIASLLVNVLEPYQAEATESISLMHGEAVSMDIGPDNALFCQMKDPSGAEVFSGFGQCKMELERVGQNHEGSWRMTVGLPGRITASEETFQVEVKHAGLVLNTVLPSVHHNGDSLTLSCSMVTDTEMNACKYIRPDSTIFIVNEGIGEGRYSFYGKGSSLTETGHFSVDCGLHITSPIALDYGNWRCVLETKEQTASGFLRVSESLSGQGDLAFELAETEKNPILAPETAVVAVAGEKLTLSCSVQAHVNYCWFRSQNGTVFSVRPGADTDEYRYVGAGFDSGECGIEIRASGIRDTGSWTCNIGIVGSIDLSVRVNVTVLASPMVVRHWYIKSGSNSVSLLVEGTLYHGGALEYCHFITPRGIGFSTDADYNFSGTDLAHGSCAVTVHNPGWDEDGMWIVSGVLHQGQEVSSFTVARHMGLQPVYSFYSMYMCMVFMLILLNVLFISAIVNKKSRRWTRTRATTLSASIRNSFRRSKSPGAVDAESRGDGNTNRVPTASDGDHDGNALHHTYVKCTPAYGQAVLNKP